MTAPESLGFMTSAQACERLGHINRSTLGRWVENGRIAHVQKLTGIRGAFLFDPDEVQRVRDELGLDYVEWDGAGPDSARQAAS